MILQLLLMASAPCSAVESFSFIHTSDQHVPYSNTEDVMREMTDLGEVELTPYGITAPQPSFIIATGDATEFGGGSGWWDDYIGILDGTGLPHYTVAGNHDNTWDTLRPRIAARHGAPYYSFDHGGVHFVGLDSASPQDPRPCFGREELLWRLYVDTYNQLTLGYGDETIVAEEAAVEALQAMRPDDIREAELDQFLEGFPQRYLRLFDSEHVYRHARLSRDIHPDEIHLFLEQKGEIWELAVVALDKPYLFSSIVGVLSYLGMDILRGNAMTSPTGLVLDIFQFTDRDGFLQFNEGAPAQLEKMLQDVVARRENVTKLLRRKDNGLRNVPGPALVPPVVYIDDEHSQRYSVLEIVAPDVPGLLYRISRIISRHGCDVELVLISTEGSKAIDVFHLTEAAAKLSESAQMALKEDLERMLEERL